MLLRAEPIKSACPDRARTRSSPRLARLSSVATSFRGFASGALHKAGRTLPFRMVTANTLANWLEQSRASHGIRPTRASVSCEHWPLPGSCWKLDDWERPVTTREKVTSGRVRDHHPVLLKLTQDEGGERSQEGESARARARATERERERERERKQPKRRSCGPKTVFAYNSHLLTGDHC